MFLSLDFFVFALLQFMLNFIHIKHYILSFEEMKRDLNRNLSMVKEEAKKAIGKIEAANAWTKTAKVERDAALAQKKAAEAKTGGHVFNRDKSWSR